MTRFTAQCCCKRCDIEVEGEPTINAICSCDNCKRRTGSAFGWSVYFPESQIVGRSGPLRVWYIEGEKQQRRWFCEECGTTLYWRADFLPGVGIAAGCFEEEPFGPPNLSSTDERRCGWVTLPDGWRLIP